MNMPSSELETFEVLICGFAGGILRRAREIPEDKWNWSFSERTPTAREICEHAWMWMLSDRQDLTFVAGGKPRAIPDLPQDRTAVLELLENEKEEWRALLQTLDLSKMDELRSSPDGYEKSVRGYLLHIAQHLVSKSGQMTMIHFELGLDGGEPYRAPHPNGLYQLAEVAWPAPRA